MKCINIIIILFPLLAQAQKIRLSEYDKFIKQRRVESYPLTLKADAAMKMDIAFIAIGTSYFVQLSGFGIGAHVISEHDKVIFLLDNDDTITVKSKGYQNYEINPEVNTYKHDYILSLFDLERLSKHNLEALRKYYAKKYDDVYVPKENWEKVKQLSSLFIEELKKGGILQPRIPGRAPAFPGGQEVWANFLKRNLKPPANMVPGEEKTVTVQFLVSADGSISNIKVVIPQGPLFDNEVIRVLRRMPKWKPAIENGRPVDAIVTQSITFYQNTNQQKKE